MQYHFQLRQVCVLHRQGVVKDGEKVVWSGIECPFRGEVRLKQAFGRLFTVVFLRPVYSAFRLPLHIKLRDAFGQHGNTVSGLVCRQPPVSVMLFWQVMWWVVTGLFCFLRVLREGGCALVASIKFGS